MPFHRTSLSRFPHGPTFPVSIHRIVFCFISPYLCGAPVLALERDPYLFLSRFPLPHYRPLGNFCLDSPYQYKNATAPKLKWEASMIAGLHESLLCCLLRLKHAYFPTDNEVSKEVGKQSKKPACQSAEAALRSLHDDCLCKQQRRSGEEHHRHTPCCVAL